MSPSDESRLTAYALGHLAEAELAEVEALLARDPEARKALAETRVIAVWMSAQMKSEISPPLPEAHRRAIEDFLGVNPGAAAATRSWFSRPALWAAAAAVLVAVVAWAALRRTEVVRIVQVTSQPGAGEPATAPVPENPPVVVAPVPETPTKSVAPTPPGPIATRRPAPPLQSLARLEERVRSAEKNADPAELARALADLGAVEGTLGDAKRAVDRFEQAAVAAARAERPDLAATILASLGALRSSSGAFEEALQAHGRALELQEKRGDSRGAAWTRVSLGEAYRSLGNTVEARASFDRALAVMKSNADLEGTAATLLGLGRLYLDQGVVPQALRLFEEALAEAERAASNAAAAACLEAIAEAQLAAGKAAEALETAHRAAHAYSALLMGPEDQSLATWGGGPGHVLEVGARAAIRLGDVAEVTSLLEQAREAEALAEVSLALRFGESPLEPDLREDLLRAQSDEATAQLQYMAAIAEANRLEVRAKREVLDRARSHRADITMRIARLQWPLLAAAALRPSDLSDIQRGLAEGDAFVEYAISGPNAFAVVATSKTARAVDLRATAAIAAACEALDEAGREGDSEWAADAESLRNLVLLPLGLASETKRLVVAPDGPLLRVPFFLLAKGRTVACVPSGGAFLALKGSGGPDGKSVLALADPAYSAAARPGFRPQAPMPGSREEARAVGDLVLLGSDASEKGLRAALGQQPRWRSVHLACRAFSDPDRPLLSSISLASHALDDGVLTALDVIGMRVPADLVVLSACDTGRGSAAGGGGAPGLVRAFFEAGASRVIASLWQVDDEATRVLMIKFYELWNPKTGSTRVGAAAALRMAQEFVRSQEKWKAPRYWAPWVLWGLPD